MNRLRVLLVGVLAGFLFLTLLALLHHGYWGFFEEALQSPATRLLFADLVLCLALVSAWMWQDSRQQGRTVWPYLLLAATFGAAGPLLYLITGHGLRSRE